ncbi:hypothetical protein CTRI78_v011618 [Colletotrichum trifolii]|uniref:Large ribosomal subunit protein mL50 n=1 Tax=Colletotrichum trifolii TaxID=5466 RepID=A0A4R8Q724_COLTR|nr:hypothetical protein CTRI78_v011618 [Colletotrichum trifolii]
MAARAAFSTTPQPASRTDKLRKLLWRGEAPGPEDPYNPEASQALKEEQRARDLAEAEAKRREELDQQLERDLEESNASVELFRNEAQQAAANTKKQRKPKRPHSRLKTRNKITKAPDAEALKEMTYVRANTIDELEEVELPEGWWDRNDRWGPESQYAGFSARAISERITDPNVLKLAVRQAVAEVVAVNALGQGEKLKEKWNVTGRAALDKALKLRIGRTENGEFLVEDKESVQSDIVSALSAEASGEETGVFADVISAEEAKEIVESLDSEWLQTPLQDPAVKFAVHKRVFQLTGQYVNDAKLLTVGTAGSFVATVVKPPKPTKVAEAIAEQELPQLRNVRVFDRRVTPIDKETMVGRWKVIKEELEKRSLPVTGHEHLPRPVQRGWITGRSPRPFANHVNTQDTSQALVPLNDLGTCRYQYWSRKVYVCNKGPSDHNPDSRLEDACACRPVYEAFGCAVVQRRPVCSAYGTRKWHAFRRHLIN